MRMVLVTLAAGAMSCQCGDRIDRTAAQLAVSPTALEFGQMSAGASATKSVRVSVIGASGVRLTDVRIDGDARSVFSLGSWPPTIAAASSEEIAVTYRAPLAAADDSATLVIDSEAENPTLTVFLHGRSTS